MFFRATIEKQGKITSNPAKFYRKKIVYRKRIFFKVKKLYINFKNYSIVRYCFFACTDTISLLSTPKGELGEEKSDKITSGFFFKVVSP